MAARSNAGALTMHSSADYKAESATPLWRWYFAPQASSLQVLIWPFTAITGRSTRARDWNCQRQRSASYTDRSQGRKVLERLGCMLQE